MRPCSGVFDEALGAAFDESSVGPLSGVSSAGLSSIKARGGRASQLSVDVGFFIVPCTQAHTAAPNHLISVTPTPKSLIRSVPVQPADRGAGIDMLPGDPALITPIQLADLKTVST
jgi:hypothetical protein